MKKLFTLLTALFIVKLTTAQIPVNMSAQKNFTYTETFTDIGNWVFNTTPVDGTFTYGIGADAWRGVAIGGTTTVPSATKITGQTTSFITNGSSTGIQKGSGSMVLLTTGTTDNSTAVAMDFFLDFTGISAGTLSYDWASINNSTGNRASSLRIYTSTDGINFTELISAATLNLLNNTPTSGSITNVALPTSFNNSATAQIRFYSYNGSGGTTGSRPKINIDNVKVTAATPTTACITPSAQPTNFIVGTATNYSIQGSFTPASPASENYMVVMSSNTALSSNPINGTTYALGDNLGDGSVVAFTHTSSFTVTGLAPSTSYNFFIFSMNSGCTNGPLYVSTNPLTGLGSTVAGGALCTAPISQPTTLVFTSINATTIKGNFKPSVSSDEYLVVRSTSSALSSQPINKTIYNSGDALGGGVVVAKSADSAFYALNLSSGTQYYFFVYGLSSKNCNSGPTYNTTLPLTGTASTVALTTCVTPANQPTALSLSASNTFINGSFTSALNTDEYLILISTATSLSTLPQDGVNYAVGNTLGNATIISNSNTTTFYANNLSISTPYYFYVFAKNSVCTNGPKYLTTSPLLGNATTTAIAALNYYFGNLHAHTFYSDGGKDNSSTIPSSAYAYAKNSLCMDFLGISEHNHQTAGMLLANYQPGINQAAAATTSNFLALYGMEWGVISNGGHVLVYGSNQLLGWEAGNYDVYVPKSDYTSNIGLFRTVNGIGNNAFATLAHPNSGDYNGITSSSVNINLMADSAIAGAALSSGPAFSTNTTYNDPATSLGYYGYYKSLLAKGYHAGPLMDHDNHYTTFGRTSNARTVFIAPSLSQTEFLKAMKGRHFYATEDCDTRVNFTLNNQIMGSIFAGTALPAISVNVIDPTNQTAVAKIKIMYGKPGSGINAIAIDSINANTFNFTDYNALNGSTGYYFAEIIIAGNKMVTAPVWYTYNTTLPVSLLSLKAYINTNKTVTVAWATSNEINNKLFMVERSSDGVNFKIIDSVNGKGNTASQINYSVIDNTPIDGINYYRLKQVDNDGKTTISNVVSVNLNKVLINYFAVYPNPVKNQLTVNINSKAEQKVMLIITDVFGRILYNAPLQLNKGNQLQNISVGQLAVGNYNLTILFDDTKITKKIVKL